MLRLEGAGFEDADDVRVGGVSCAMWTVDDDHHDFLVDKVRHRRPPELDHHLAGQRDARRLQHQPIGLHLGEDRLQRLAERVRQATADTAPVQLDEAVFARVEKRPVDPRVAELVGDDRQPHALGLGLPQQVPDEGGLAGAQVAGDDQGGDGSRRHGPLLPRGTERPHWTRRSATALMASRPAIRGTGEPMGLPTGLLERAHELRRELHRHPELSNDEHRTSARLAQALRELGLEPRSVGGTGLVADLVADIDGPTICIRGDIDALPLHEASGCPDSSQNPDVMHACGHDVHAAATWAAAALLVECPPPGIVRVLFQPAEELGTGAHACVRDGAMEGVHAVLGGHVDLRYPVGTVAMRPGPMCASTDEFRVRITGRATHGARPHLGTDALLAAAQVVIALQQVVAREIRPGDPAVITVGRLRAGERANILAGSAELWGTVRAQSESVREQICHAIRRICAGIGAAAGVEVSVERLRGNGPVCNDPYLSEHARAALRAGGIEVVPLADANMGGEDFSALHADRPGVYVRWGAAGPHSNPDPAHSPGFRVDPGVLEVAATGLAACARAAVAALRVPRPVEAHSAG